MGIFSSIMQKIFHHPAAQAAAPAQPPPAQAAPVQAAPAQPAPAAQASMSEIDVEGVLVQMAADKGGGGNWRSSIVDLLKLLDLDSSLGARHELADELDVHAGPDGSAEENIALHHAVMAKLAQNGGRVPDSLR
jgi:hypothetical protein